MNEKILIIDFGSQYTKLIARRIREMHVFSEIVSPTQDLSGWCENPPKGIILSGGPDSVHTSNLKVDSKLFQISCPILGICFGMQIMNALNGGVVQHQGRGEYGKQKINIDLGHPLFENLSPQEQVWMSHGDSIEKLAPGFQPIANSTDGHVAAISHITLPHFGLQFHPEVTHTKQGNQLIKNFLNLSNCKGSWTMDCFIEKQKEEIRKKVGSGRVVSLVSGGVDSTASTFLCREALGPDRVYPLHVDTGLMRQGESKQVVELLKSHGMKHLIFIDASERFLSALNGITEPERKRHIIGTLFIELLEEEMDKLDAYEGTTYFCQGTLYTDLIESGKGCGKHAAVIKSHHNVNIPIVEEKRKQGLILEPNRQIFKDEVREVCRLLNIPKDLVWRHPFPGPGLAIRVIGEVTAERLKTLRQADAIYLEEITKAGLYDQIWQAFAILLPIQSVGVMGDQRTVGHVIALRAVESSDGMTADFSTINHDILGRISTRIINEVNNINRVVYDITSKPPGTIEWE